MPVPRPVPPDARTRAWVASVVHPRGTVVDVRALKGGITASVHAIRVAHPGCATTVVVRRWIQTDDGPEQVRREARILEHLGYSLAPELLAIDEDGSHADVPAVVMSRLPGRVVLGTDDEYLRGLARVLPAIHALSVDAPPFEAWGDQREPPVWAQRPHLWRAAFRLHESTSPPRDVCFVHRDFQHFNVLWSRGRVSGVVDWVWGSLGSPDVDVAHERLNLALLHSVEVAERFRAIYEAEAGRVVDPWWDLRELVAYLPGWGHYVADQANMGVDLAGMPARVEGLLAAVLARC